MKRGKFSSKTHKNRKIRDILSIFLRLHTLIQTNKKQTNPTRTPKMMFLCSFTRLSHLTYKQTKVNLQENNQKSEQLKRKSWNISTKNLPKSENKRTDIDVCTDSWYNSAAQQPAFGEEK
jgi:calcineurin-like phosphoesterase family protein